MERHIRLAIPFVALAALSACQSARTDYPSLAIRDAERVEGTFAVGAGANPLPAPAPLPADTLERVAVLIAQAEDAHAQFLRAAPGARNAVSAARGASVESNAWAAAQIALADLESTRSTAAIVLGDLDLLYADTTLAYTAREEVSAAREAVVALISAEDTTLAELRGAMGS